MKSSSAAGVILVAIALLVGLGLLRYKPWQGAGGAPDQAGLPAVAVGDRAALRVGFLPVT